MYEFLLSQIKSIIDYMQAGGIVMFPLFIISFVMWALIVERILFFNLFSRMDIKRMILERISGQREGEIRLSMYPLLDKNIPIIKTLALIAPLLGLLGTVTGMIKTFGVISMFGTGNVKLMTKGISEALITTQTGLIVAIPGLYMSRFLERRSERIKHDLDSAIMYAKRHI